MKEGRGEMGKDATSFLDQGRDKFSSTLGH